MGTRNKSIDGPGSTQKSDPQPTEMSASQKVASHVRKVSQLSSALGVSHVKNLSPAMENKNSQQHFQILHTAVQGQERRQSRWGKSGRWLLSQPRGGSRI